MKEFRRDVEHKPDSEYHWVVLGPIPGYPAWHTQAGETRYPFSKEQAAFTFADSVKAIHPERRVEVRTVDGERFVL